MNVIDIANKVKTMEAQLARAKEDKARLSGRLEEMYHRLNEEFGLANLEEAVGELDRLSTEIKDDEARIEGMYLRLKEQYGWEEK